MSELKFRAWSKNLNKYIGGILLNGAGFLYGLRLGFEIGEENAEDYVIEQYTGLKDKNGKEIYEGDIVEALIDGVWETGRNTVSFGKAKWRLEVLYNDIRFMDVFKIIGSKSNPDRIYYLFDKELSELEVIGNIHENADLLEEKE